MPIGAAAIVTGIGQTVFRICALAAVVAAAGCTLDIDKFRQSVAEYDVKPEHKAYYLNPINYGYWMSWGYRAPQEALKAAKDGCEKNSGGHCIPVAVNDRILYNPVPKAAHEQAQEEQNEAILLQIIGSMHRR